ncbi:hypothetical protein MRX96_030970 [Rhipicephalus microplus]
MIPAERATTGPVAVQCSTPNGVRRRACSERCKSAAGTLSRPMVRTALTRPAPRRASQFPRRRHFLPPITTRYLIAPGSGKTRCRSCPAAACDSDSYIPSPAFFFHLDVGAATAEPPAAGADTYVHLWDTPEPQQSVHQRRT